MATGDGTESWPRPSEPAADASAILFVSRAEVEDAALERLFGLAQVRAERPLTFDERRQLEDAEKWLRENTDGGRRG